MIFRFLVAAAVSFLLTTLGHYYLYVRIVEPLAKHSTAVWTGVFVFLWALTFFGFAVARAVPVILRRYVELVMFVWMGTAYIFLLFAILTSPVSLAFHVFDVSETWLALGLLVVSSVLVIWSLFKTLRPETIVAKDIPVRGDLPEQLSNMRCVVLSDVHVAGLVGRRRMTRLARRVNELKPDIVFVTGDLVDGTVAQLKNEVKPLGNIKPPLGVYYVTGNHEYYCNPSKWKAYCAEVLGWNVLSNSNAQIQYQGVDVNILGIEDRSSLHSKNGKRLPDVRIENAKKGVSEARQRSALNILLAHQPKDTRVLKKAPFVDVQISGHTHGGQFWPLKLLVLSDQKYNKGLYTLPNGARLYVTEGTGFWGPPMRLGTSCEISLLRFVPTQGA
jgi:uncharacterized protein